VKIVDANILLYAINPSERRHGVARSWLDEALTQAEPIGFSWLVLLAFLRISTLPGAFARPISPAEAAEVMQAWLDQPAALVIEPTSRHPALLRGLIEPLGTGGNIVNDAHLAALAIEHGAEVVSFDTDFGRFPGVRWRLPDSSADR
jgi:toxin-antitoxin system PIN domain toxin